MVTRENKVRGYQKVPGASRWQVVWWIVGQQRLQERNANPFSSSVTASVDYKFLWHIITK